MKSIEVVLVAGRRPKLLEATLSSFSNGLFRNFNILKFSANIDPFGGSSADHEECRKIIFGHFPNARLLEPERASFGAAVQRLWGATTSDIVFHLEDDWLIDHPIGPDAIEPLGFHQVAAMPLLSAQHNWKGDSLFYEHDYRARLFGVIKLKKKRLPRFGTSPRFLAGDFARQCASMMIPKMDPEKQMHMDVNRKLMEYLISYRSQLIVGKDRQPVIRDIGRDWHRQNGIRKIVERGVTRWEGADKLVAK